MAQPPPHWPQELNYISKCTFASSLPKDIRAEIQGNVPSGSKSGAGKPPSSNKPSNKRLVAIKKITDSKHPTFGQRGLFAAQKIPANTLIIQYVGEIHSDERPTSDYDLSLYKSRILVQSKRLATAVSSDSLSGPPQGTELEYEYFNVGIDAARMGNEARFINDYRGTGASRANVFFKDIRIDGELCMTVWSGKEGVQKGEELLVSYGKGWWDARKREEGTSAQE